MGNPTWDDLLKYKFINRQNIIIFDVGGYVGDFTDIITKKYDNCIVYIFEPVKLFYEIIKERFYDKENIKIYNFGLGDFNGNVEISLSHDSSSVYKKNGEKETIKMVDIIDFVKNNGIKHIDLIKINIEGGEYPLMKHLISKGKIALFDNYLIQFHSFVDNAVQQRLIIQQKMELTYKLTCNYDFIFENWGKMENKIYCLGDSHISMLGNKTKLIPTTNSWIKYGRFLIMQTGAKLAYSLMDNIDLYKKHYKDVMNDADSLLFAFGEIDCRAHVKRQSIIQNKDVDIIIEEIVASYLSFISNINKEQYKHIIVLGVVPCHVEMPYKEYYEEHLNDIDCPMGSMEERNKYKVKFNSVLAQECDAFGYEFVSIYNDICKDGIINEDYYMDEIHLNPKKVYDLINSKIK